MRVVGELGMDMGGSDGGLILDQGVHADVKWKRREQNKWYGKLME